MSKVGPVSQFAEPDYLYGVGSLTMRVESIDWSSPTRYDGENWYWVKGIEMTTDGREIGPRQALVRGRRLVPPRKATRSSGRGSPPPASGERP
jgi:hypothetical protein